MNKFVNTKDNFKQIDNIRHFRAIDKCLLYPEAVRLP
jgi:hypothetical protein